MKSEKKLWIAFALVMSISFAVLIYYGFEIYQQAPPVPEKVVTTDGEVLFSGQDIKDGQNVWQSMGGQEVGTVWGHGAYLAPDWTADWLHREADFILNKYSEADSTRLLITSIVSKKRHWSSDSKMNCEKIHSIPKLKHLLFPLYEKKPLHI